MTTKEDDEEAKKIGTQSYGPTRSKVFYYAGGTHVVVAEDPVQTIVYSD